MSVKNPILALNPCCLNFEKYQTEDKTEKYQIVRKDAECALFSTYYDCVEV